MEKKHELNYSERLTIRRALEQYSRSQKAKDYQEDKEAERLEWLFKDAVKIEVTEQE